MAWFITSYLTPDVDSTEVTGCDCKVGQDATCVKRSRQVWRPLGKVCLNHCLLRICFRKKMWSERLLIRQTEIRFPKWIWWFMSGFAVYPSFWMNPFTWIISEFKCLNPPRARVLSWSHCHVLAPLSLAWCFFARGEVSLQCEVPRSIQCDFWPVGPPSWDDKAVTFPAVMLMLVLVMVTIILKKQQGSWEYLPTSDFWALSILIIHDH